MKSNRVVASLIACRILETERCLVFIFGLYKENDVMKKFTEKKFIGGTKGTLKFQLKTHSQNSLYNVIEFLQMVCLKQFLKQFTELIKCKRQEGKLMAKKSLEIVNGLAISRLEFVFPRNQGTRGSVTRNGTPLIATVSVNG